MEAEVRATRDGRESSTASVTRRNVESGSLTTKTEQAAMEATRREALPSRNPLMSLSPREPIRMRSALQRWASFIIVDAIGP